jgi:hypothetical protein
MIPHPHDPTRLLHWGDFQDQRDAKWIVITVIREPLRGHNDTPYGSQPLAGLLAALRAYFVFLVIIY